MKECPLSILTKGIYGAPLFHAVQDRDDFNGDKQERKNHGRDGKGQGQNQRPAGPAERAGAEAPGGRE